MSVSVVHPDLSFKQLKALILFQEIYKLKRYTVHTLNKTLDTVYRTLVSVSNNINNNYLGNIITLDQYRTYMEKTDTLVNLLRNIPRPLTIRHIVTDKLLKSRVLHLHYLLYEIVKVCGASCCYDIFKCFCGDDWDLYINQRYLKLIDLYNTIFVPVMVKTVPTVTEELKVVKYSSFTLSIMLKIHGAEITVSIGNTTIIIKGYFRDDPLNIARIGGTLEAKFAALSKEAYIRFKDADQTILTNYLQQIPLRDFIGVDHGTLLVNIGEDIKDLNKLRNSPKSSVIEEFLKASMKRQYTMLTMLLLDQSTHNYAQSLISTLSAQDSANLYRILHWSVQKRFDQVSQTLERITSAGIQESSIPYETRIELLNATEMVKKKAYDKLKEIKNSREGNDKAIKYLDGLLRIPFGIYQKEPILQFMTDFAKKLKEINNNTTATTENEITLALAELNTAHLTEAWLNFKTERKQYLSYVKQTLENCIYGQEEAKRYIETIIAQWINGEMTGTVFGFQGYPGTGKTSLAKHGIAKCIRDAEGNSRPFFFISLGGANGGNTFLGHSYTYVGSQWGKLADCLQVGKVMNPIFYFDELDKVSDSAHGEEIIRILTHLTDPEQNDHIEDRYFGIELDYSKALIIFSYNNSTKIDEVLMDRIHEIRFKPYNHKDKMHIASKYLLPKILKTHGYAPGSLIFPDDILHYIIDGYTIEAGVRDIKEKLSEVARDFNLRRIYNEEAHPLPFTVTRELIDDVLKSKNKVLISSIPPKSQVGWVNGLYATAMGTGGLTVIQVFNTPSEHKYHMELTGKLGDVMKESVKCAKTISWSVLPKDDRATVNAIWQDEAIHIHFPAGGTSKDGPSAGIAITLAVVSYFSKLAVRNYIAMTGEIDLYGNVLPIGGLQCKIEGAERAGVKLVLIPRDNEKDYIEFSKDVNISVFAVDNISQIIRTCLIGAETKDFVYAHSTEDDTTKKILEQIQIIDLEFSR